MLQSEDNKSNSLMNTDKNSIRGNSQYLQLLHKKRKTRWDEPIPISYKPGTRRSRWASTYEKTFTPIPLSYIPSEIDINRFEILIRKYRLEDIGRRIQTSDWENADPDLRSPSPEPIYDPKTGKRLNTRDVRTREKYVEEKHKIIEELMDIDPNYRAPSDYKKPKKVKKLYINEIENEKHKLIGIVIGPQGSTLRDIEKKSGCKISIRGKGSNWKGINEKTYLDEKELLHVHVEGDKEGNLLKAVRLIEPLLNANSPEHIAEKKRQQQALAKQFGYNTEVSCETCGERGHKEWACPLNIETYTRPDIKCDICGDKSHPTRDCPERETTEKKAEAESELSQILREVDTFKKSADVNVIEDEKLAKDIRNSVIFTGKVHETKKEEKVRGESKEINNNKIYEDCNKTNTDSLEIKEIKKEEMSAEKPSTTHPQQTKNKEEEQQSNLTSIFENPNVVKSGPVNYMSTQNTGTNSTKYTPSANISANYQGHALQYSMLNPFAFPMAHAPNQPQVRQNNPYYGLNSRGMNFISSNFQGKIPYNYGTNEAQEMNPFMTINGLNQNALRQQFMNINRPPIGPNLQAQNLNTHGQQEQPQPPEPESEPEPEDDIKVEKEDNMK